MRCRATEDKGESSMWKYFGTFVNALAVICGGSIGLALVLYYGLKLISMWAISQVCMLLSGVSQKNQTAILLCIGVLLVPAALTAIGSDAAAMFSLLMPLATVEIFHLPWPFLLTAAVGIGASALSWYLQAKRYRN